MNETRLRMAALSSDDDVKRPISAVPDDKYFLTRVTRVLEYLGEYSSTR